ncbi:MAG: YihA family ribosome biogenesis GTP-binding protein [Ruminococcaceae bacterium]|nr:YihA family ribosome biogenesis GTP-binding protein [Oscillospiraceae bacterium]
MNLHRAELTISAVHPRQYPATGMPEIAMAGRSNVGKSSCINKLLNRNKLARTSSTPGKTATINFYNIDDQLFLVDLPGYGFARVSKAEQEKWGAMINTYLDKSVPLCGVLLLVDARHKPTTQDVMMYSWIRERFGEVTVVATKADKLGITKLPPALDLIRSTLGLSENDTLLAFSGEKGTGKDELWQEISRITGVEL